MTLPLIAALPRMASASGPGSSELLHTAEPTDDADRGGDRRPWRSRRARYARERALRLAQQADGELDALPPSPARDALRASITYVMDRRR